MKKKIILASTSPNRKELLSETGLAFDIVHSNYEEDMTLPLAPKELAMHLSKGKAMAVAELNPEAIVIGADTFTVHNGKIIGKPHTPEKAKETLRMFSGVSHTVVTGFTVIHLAEKREQSHAVETKVHFRNLSEAEIEAYVATGEPLNKAGAYGIFQLGRNLIEKVEGDISNVAGLPIATVIETLKGFGVEI